MPSASSPVPPLSPGKLRVFRSLALLLALAAALTGSEWFLRQRQRHIAASDRLEPGLVQYDPGLGWRLQAGWQGAHRHHDFTARYATDLRGFRADTAPANRSAPARFTAVLGDSFTFGLGVNDDQTFVHRLDTDAAGGMRFRNFAVPGYSTDQQALLLEQQILPLRPARVLLVVYLGNDLLDNLRSVPLQVRSPKPHFEPGPAGLMLRNSPVRLPPPPPVPGDTLTAAILGFDASTWPGRVRLEQHCEVFRLASQAWGGPQMPPATLAARLSPAVALFERILDRLHRACDQAGVDLRLVLLAGRSHAVSPRSLSAQYQDYFRVEVAGIGAKRRLVVIDAATPLRAAAAGSRSLFFPHDGHLTPAGHEVLADLLARELSR